MATLMFNQRGKQEHLICLILQRSIIYFLEKCFWNRHSHNSHKHIDVLRYFKR